MILAILTLISASNEVATSRTAMAKYVHCLVDRAGYRMRKLLDQPVSERAGGQWGALATEGCLSDTSDESELRFKPSLMRGAAFEEFYKRDFGATGDLDFSKVAPVEYPRVSGDTDHASAEYGLSMSVADCAVRRAPSEARTLILSPVASIAENAAIQALKPALAACIDQSASLTFSKSVVRDITAEALYRLTAAKRKSTHA